MWKLNLFSLLFIPPRIVSHPFDSAVTYKIVTQLLSLLTMDQTGLILGLYIEAPPHLLVPPLPPPIPKVPHFGPHIFHQPSSLAPLDASSAAP